MSTRRDTGVAPVGAQLDPADASFDSLAAQQLRRGFPWLRFRAPLENEFRVAYRGLIRGQMRVNLWLGLGLVAALTLIERFAFAAELNEGLDSLRVAAIVPTLLAVLVVTYTRHYGRVFDPMMQLLAPLFGITIVIEALVASRFGVSVFAVVVLTVISLYLMVGLLFYAALRTAVIVFAAYLIGAEMLNLPTEQAAYNFVVLLATNIVGATVCYALEKVHRTNYLEARLLTEMACRDGLTGIYNRRMFDEHLDKAWQQAGRERVFVALLLVDIDYFKAYNDHYGHQAGDECLKNVAKALGQCARRPLDFTARYGGEEFAIVLYDARRDYVEEQMRQIQQGIAGLVIEHAASSVSKQLTVSIGAAWVLPRVERSHYGFIQLADEALYDAKGAGRNRTVLMDKEYEDLSTGSFRNRTAAATT
ncbi:MAG TPA: diguanylate cyclase, partial [Steroidobacteraceae bacterium]|nr:diguanylate cyclase [Steroidobacteraceae bacterium]